MDEKELKTSSKGLTSKEVAKRQEKYGMNVLPKKQRTGLETSRRYAGFEKQGKNNK